MPVMQFTVDAHLLEELGERLVGKPSIALAELVKNGYDADATKTEIGMFPKENYIAVRDNGHGMDFKEFKDFWMRVGSPHKMGKVSRRFNRKMTGQKGVGRLAVQMLADGLKLRTVSDKDPTKKIEAKVTWSEAIGAEELTEATVEYQIRSGEEEFDSGTEIILSDLKHEWSSKKVKELAGELWWLEPPFRGRKGTRPKNIFKIDLISSEEEYEKAFEEQMNAILDIWGTRLVGENSHGSVDFSLEFKGDDKPIKHSFQIPDCKLEGGSFEIRIYHLEYRQPHGVKVGKAREYFREYGGVHVYDGGFHLPYYGTPDNDWLKIQYDQAQRKTTSELLPEELQVKRGLQQLPTLSRVFGVVKVDTSKEGDLDILVTRDRLKNTRAFKNLKYMIRYAMDFYAMEKARRKFEERKEEREVRPPEKELENVEEVLEKYDSEISDEVYEEVQTSLKSLMKSVDETVKKERENLKEEREKISLMSPLATAGMTALAVRHEFDLQIDEIENIKGELGKIKVRDEKVESKLEGVRDRLDSWKDRARKTNKLFEHIAEEGSREEVKRYRAKWLVGEVMRQLSEFLTGVEIRTESLDKDLRLPKGTIAEWSSIFQNVLTNAYNAINDPSVKEPKEKIIHIKSKKINGIREILIQNTGRSVDLEKRDKYFEPFERETDIPQDRRGPGRGGTGIGLTIVDMISRKVGCEVSFVEPENNFSTALSIKWEEI